MSNKPTYKLQANLLTDKSNYNKLHNKFTISLNFLKYKSKLKNSSKLILN